MVCTVQRQSNSVVFQYQSIVHQKNAICLCDTFTLCNKENSIGIDRHRNQLQHFEFEDLYIKCYSLVCRPIQRCDVKSMQLQWHALDITADRRRGKTEALCVMYGIYIKLLLLIVIFFPQQPLSFNSPNRNAWKSIVFSKIQT